MPHALIIGGSMGGLFSALLLQRIGWEVDVFERSPSDLSSRGAGIATHDEMHDVLAMVGIDVGKDLGVEINGRQIFNPDGSHKGTHDFSQVMTSWDRLYRLLREALPEANYHPGKRLQRVIRDPNGVSVMFAHGDGLQGDLLIGADGVRSTVRKQYLRDIEPIYAGYVIWRGMVPERKPSATTQAALADRLSFCVPPGEQFLTYPIPGADESRAVGERRWNWAWYRSTRGDAELDALLTDREGRRLDVSMPPDRVNVDLVEEMREAGRARLAPQLNELIECTEHPFIQAIFDFESPEIVFGRAILLGDAAFVARPHTGAGVTKAAEDARVLADSLAAHPDDIDAGLAEWSAQRLAYGRAAVARGRELGKLIHADRNAPEGDTFGKARGVAGAVMEETGVSAKFG